MRTICVSTHLLATLKLTALERSVSILEANASEYSILEVRSPPLPCPVVPPPLAPETTLPQLMKLTAATLRLHVDLAHLPHGGNKAAIAQRLHDHLHAGDSSDPSSGDDDDENPSDNESSAGGSDNESSPAESGSENPASDPSDSSESLTAKQRQAIKKTVSKLLKKRRSRKDSPTPPSPSPPPKKKRKARRRTHHRRSRSRSRSSSGTTTSSSATSRSPSPRRRSRSPSPHHRSHRRRSRRRSRSPHHRSHHRSRSHSRPPASTLPVPRKIRHAITKGEYVDLSDLLSEHLALSGSSAKSGSSRKSARTRHITSLDTWLEAWSLYAAVLAAHKPALAPELFKYQSFITPSSRRFQPYAWLQYDTQFRLKLTANRSDSWAAADPELTATWLSADATKPKTQCFSCGNPDHMAAACPFKSTTSAPGIRCPVCDTIGHTARDCPQLFRAPANTANAAPNTNPRADATRSASNDNAHCRIFNQRGFCYRGTRCPYPHTCSGCNGGHPKRACPVGQVR